MGHGRAIVELQRRGDLGREDDIVAACVADPCFDYQCDEQRGWYLAEVLLATGRPNEYLDRLIKPSRRHDQDQWANLLQELALRGLDQAKSYIRDRWSSDLQKGSCAFAEAFITVDGASAYNSVLAHAQACWVNRRKEVRDAFGLHMVADDVLGGKRAARVRAPYVSSGSRILMIGAFPEYIEANRKPNAPKPEMTLEEKVRAGRYVYRRSLTDDEVQKIAELLDAGLEGKAAARALQCLDSRPFPLDLNILFRYLDSEDGWVRSCALDALGANRDPAIRELAFTYCGDENMRSDAIGVLRSNFLPGDEAWIEEQYKRLKTPYGHHGEVHAIRNVIEAVPRGKWASLLRLMLETVGCDICRHNVVDKMKARRLLTDTDLTELALDTYSPIRSTALKLARQRCRGSLKSQPLELALHGG